MTYNVHDLFVRHAMNFPDVSIPFLRYFLDQKALELIELDRIELTKESFVSKSLREKISDIVFKVPYSNMVAYLYILIEHKSEGADKSRGSSIPFQLHCQQVALMDCMRKRDREGLLPLVLSLGLYHGKTLYKGVRSIAEQMRAPVELIPGFWKEPTMIVDLGGRSDREILALGGKLSIFLLVLKHVYDDNSIESLRQLQSQIGEVEYSRDGIQFIQTVILYLMDTAKSSVMRLEVEKLAISSLSEEGGRRMLALGEAYRQEGRLEGRIEGREEGREEERKKWEEVLASERQERLKMLSQSCRVIRKTGASFAEFVETFKLSTEDVEALIRQYPDLVSDSFNP